jgi:hypothetical protein
LPPNAPVIFLHYDYMVSCQDCLFPGDPGISFAPDPADIDLVVEAFRRHGITLVIDPQHTAIPYDDMGMGFAACPPSHQCSDFFDLKAQYFKPKGRQPWHYVIFGGWGFLNGQLWPLISGAAEQSGYNVMVTINPFGPSACTFGSQVDFCQYRQAGTFMHELGHNLGLQHGGDEEENYKPNYVSVMNYLFQIGIPYARPGDTHQFSPNFTGPTLEDRERIVGMRLDYSDGTMPSLDENHVDERAGLGGSPEKTSVAWFQPKGTYSFRTQSWDLGCYDYDGRYSYVHAAAQPADWNFSGQIESDVPVDINWNWTWTLAGQPWPMFDVCPVYSVLHDYDDWSHIQAFLKTPQYLTGTLRPVKITADPPAAGPGPAR